MHAPLTANVDVISTFGLLRMRNFGRGEVSIVGANLQLMFS